MVISHSYVSLPEGNFNPIPIAIFVGFYMALAYRRVTKDPAPKGSSMVKPKSRSCKGGFVS